MSLGPVMLDLRGPDLCDDEQQALLHPMTGGVILFSRNYSDPAQLSELTDRIHKLRTPPLLIAVDHEGGRVQRFRDQFTRLPACRLYGDMYDKNQVNAVQLCEKGGWLMAAELLAAGVDFSFAPILDIDSGRSKVIGDRAFHSDSDAVTDLARGFIRGMKFAGMSPVGKHFPGHGYVRADSHESVPIDERRYEDIMMCDLIPFERLINAGLLAGIMPAHVIYPVIDDKPAGFSRTWLQDILRTRIGFHGAVFSDDLGMAGAEVAGSFTERAYAALDAGCDMVLVCNHQDSAFRLLDELDVDPRPDSQVRLMRMHAHGARRTLDELRNDIEWRTVVAEITEIESTPELDLDDDEIPT